MSSLSKALFSLTMVLSAPVAFAQCVSLTTAGSPYTQNFDTLSNTAGSTTNNLTIPGWFMTETGGGARDNEQYGVDTGSSNTGDTYSYGAAGSTDRALGALRSGTLVPLFGACFTNNTGSTLTSLAVGYTGEQWRLGTAARTDSINFQYSINATDLNTGTWTGVAALNFTTPDTATVGAKNGNAAAGRTAISSTISGLNIANGATFWIRWTDTDATGADDGLAVDDFSLTPNTGAGLPTLSINDVSVSEGNSGTTSFTFTVSLSQAATQPVTFDIATADNTAQAPSDYTAKTLANQQIEMGGMSYTFTVLVNGDTTNEPNETFFVNVTNVNGAVAVDNQGQGTIVNDDFTCTPTATIAQVQGSGDTSPLVNTVVTTSGIVTARKFNGYFIQMPVGDGDPNTSDGVFVFTSSTPPASAEVGASVCVTATVQEFIPSTDPNSPSSTELASTTGLLVIGTGNALPTPVTLTASNTNPAGPINQLEKYEGMRVAIDSLTAVAPTQGTVNEPAATSTSTGLFFGVITGIARPFREPGVQLPDPLPPGSPCCVPRWDTNPEILAVDSDALIGATPIDVASGAILANVVGPLDYSRRAYTIDTEPSAPPTVTNNTLSAIPVPSPAIGELTIANFNMERFFDTTDDPSVSDVALTPTAFANRLNKASLAIRNVLRYPDILGVEEMENLATLQAVATKVNNDAVTAGDPNPNYQPYLTEGNDIGGIDVGFLVKPSKVTVTSVTQYGKTTTFVDPVDSSVDLLNDRPPLVLVGNAKRVDSSVSLPITVIVNHLRSLTDIDSATDGPRVRRKREVQAEYLANLIQSFQAADPAINLVSIGDYNAFQFNDGYVDVMGVIKGTPAPVNQVVEPPATITNPTLTDLIDVAPAGQKYSYSFSGSAQEIDHILVNPNMLARVSRYAVARNDADFPETYRNDPNRPERLSDHDMPVSYFNLPLSPDLKIAKQHTGNFVQGQLSATYTLTVTNVGASPSSGTVTVIDTIPSGLTLVSMSGSGWTCGSPVNTCVRNDALGFSASYPAITATVNVSASAPSIVTNMASVANAGDLNGANNGASDPANVSAVIDNSSKVSVTQTGFGRNRATGIWTANMTVANASASVLSGPLQVVLTNLTPGVAMTNNTGTWNGSPYITVSAGSLAPGASVTVPIQFTNPSNVLINFTPVTLSGSLN